MFLKLGRYMNPGPPVMLAAAAAAAAMPASAVFDIDATQITSYPGTGAAIANLIASPPETGTFAFDNDGLVFTGSAGSAAAYFNADHIDDFIVFSGSQPDFILDFHKSVEGKKGWVGQAFRMGPHDSTPGTSMAFFGNENNPALQGFAAYYTFASDQIRFQIANGVSGVTYDWTYKLAASTDYILLFSLSHSGGNTDITLYINGVSQGTVSHAVSTSTDAGSVLCFMNDDTQTGQLIDARFYWAGMGNDALTQDDVDLIGETLETRHARTYDDAFAYSIATISGINADWEIDPRVGQSHSYTAQTIKSLVASPTVGARSNYEFWRGADGSATTTDPTNDGTGFASDGGDYMALKSITGTNIAKHHRSDQAGSWVGVIIQTENPLAGAEAWWGNTAGTGAGARFILQTDERFDLLIANGTATVTVTNVSGVMAAGTHMIFVTWNGTATTNNVKVAVNSTSFLAFSATLGASTVDSTQVFTVPGSVGGSLPGNGTRVLWAGGGSAFLSDAQLANIVTLLESADRHNTNYA